MSIEEKEEIEKRKEKEAVSSNYMKHSFKNNFTMCKSIPAGY